MGCKISNMVWEKERIYRELKIRDVSLDLLNKEIDDLKNKAYEKEAIHMLVNYGDIDCNNINTLDMSYGDDGDYTIITSRGSVDINDENLYFNSEKEYEKYIKENEIEDAPEWWDFADYSEIYWNEFYRYNDLDIDLDIANEIGLPVIELKNGDTYVSISGCGMDLSFQIMEYQALAFGRIEEKFATKDKLEWAKMNMSEERYKNMLKHLGVSIDNRDNR